jgi:hypothetical protein
MIVVYLIAALGFLAGITWLFARYMAYVTERAVTRHFRAAEEVTEGHIPRSWLADINRRTKARNLLQRLRKDVSPKALALDRLEALRRFFEDCPFIANDETRAILLQELDGTREAWEGSSWGEIVSNVPASDSEAS